MEPILHGFILAVGLILPLGVQNIFIFSQGATQPTLTRAFPAAITAAMCDTLLILFAVFGLSLIVQQLEWLRISLMIAGIVFLIYMGYRIWRSEPVDNGRDKALPIRQQVIFAASVSLLNPHAFLDTVGVIGISAIQYVGSDQMLFTVICILVSWLWFFGLTIIGASVKKLDRKGDVMKIVNKLSAIFIWGTAIYISIGMSRSLFDI